MLAAAHPERLRISLRTSREEPPCIDTAAGVVGYAHGRAEEADLERELRWLGCEPLAVREGTCGVPWRPQSTARERGTARCARPTGAYVCGPAAMTAEVTAALKRMGVPTYSEQWW